MSKLIVYVGDVHYAMDPTVILSLCRLVEGHAAALSYVVLAEILDRSSRRAVARLDVRREEELWSQVAAPP